jgi:hypothetical protein
MNPKKRWDQGASAGGYPSPTTPRAPFARAKTQLAADKQAEEEIFERLEEK